MTLEELAYTLSWGFHDAYLVRFEVDHLERAFTIDLLLQIGKGQETDQLARIRVSGLAFFVALPPHPDPKDIYPDELLWMDAGPGQMKGDEELDLPAVPDGHFLHHFYTRGEWQTFYVCGRDASLTWLEPEPQPARHGRRAAFPGDPIPDR